MSAPASGCRGRRGERPPPRSSPVHEDHTVSDLPGELHLVRDDEHRHALARQVAHDDEDLADELRVESRRDLVEEHHVWLHHQRPGNGDPLLLPARELVRMLPSLLREADAREELASSRLRFLTRHPSDPPCRQRQVVERGELWEEVELLEDDPDALPDGGDVHAFARDLLTLEEDAPRLDRLEQVDAAEQRALPASARADDTEHLAVFDAQVDAVENDVVAEALVDVLHADHGGAIRASSLDRCRRDAHCPERSKGIAFVRSSG